ncbi:MAG: decaprenyl-phosphate phosphoribosyltransferase [Betaproteobacteria bacterium]|nr:MAG: decaprenyl-phosphate phosphoribosyltransferase [Betaproteobacteria bacterium]
MSPSPGASTASFPLQLLRLLRPHQWVKNGFVFIGLLFSDVSDDWGLRGNVLYAAAGFCLLSSCVYVLNDMFDRKADQAHPLKRHRPLANGTVGMGAAFALACVCAIAGLALGAAAATRVAAILLAYLLLNLAYSAGLKHVAILDVFIIAAGFMLRIFAGTWGVGIAPSQWLLLCGLLLTIFLGFAKRRAELMVSANDGAIGASQRPVLDDYSPALLDTMMAISAAGVIVSYSLYTVSPDTVELHHTDNLIYTLPFVLYGMFRYIFLVHRRGGEDPASTLLTDAHMIVTGAAWLGVTLWLIW